MTPKERAAMQQALEALQKAEMVYAVRDVHPMAVKQVEEAITALREALAETVKQAISEEAFNWIDANAPMFVREALAEPKCWCETCRPITMDDMRMVLCPTCGNKRCPHATDHRNACTGSNKPGQKGSSYEHCKPAEQAEQEPVAFRFPRDTESWTGGWTIDYKVIRSVDAEIEDNEFKPCLESVEQVLLALEKVCAAPQPVKQEPVAFKFIRYVDGKEMAEGVTIEREKTLDAAIKKAVALCPNRDRTVLVCLNPVRTKDLDRDEIEEVVSAWWKEDATKTYQDLCKAAIAADRKKNK